MSGFMNLIGLANVLGGFESLQSQLGGDPVYLVGTNVTYGVFLEIGTSKMQAYPWLRPAVDEFRSTPKSFVRRHAGKNIDDADSTAQIVEWVSLALERRMVDNVTLGGSRSPGTESGHPRRQSGNLAGSIKAVRVR